MKRRSRPHIKTFQNFLIHKLYQLTTLIDKNHAHDIARTIQWHKNLCKAIDLAFGKDHEMKVREFPKRSQLLSIGTANGQCVACLAIQDSKVMLIDFKERVSSMTFRPTFKTEQLNKLNSIQVGMMEGAKIRFKFLAGLKLP